MVNFQFIVVVMMPLQSQWDFWALVICHWHLLIFFGPSSIIGWGFIVYRCCIQCTHENLHKNYEAAVANFWNYVREVIHKPRGQYFGYFGPLPLHRHFYWKRLMLWNGHLANSPPLQLSTWFMNDPRAKSLRKKKMVWRMQVEEVLHHFLFTR